MMLAILSSLKSMETLENGLQTHFGASLQSCCNADAWCKRALKPHFFMIPFSMLFPSSGMYQDWNWELETGYVNKQ